MRVSRICAGVVAGLALPAGHALAGPTFDGPNGMTFDYYGHLAAAFVSADDGVGTESYVGDDTASPSRLGFNIRRPYGATTFRFNFETALGFPGTSEYDNDPTTPTPTYDWTKADLRKIDFSLSNSGWGRISTGQGSMASDSSAEQDFSGTALTTYVGFRDLAGGILFRDSTTGALSRVDIDEAFDSFDGNSRKGRIRYDSPEFAGFIVSASWGREILIENSDSTFYDVALTYGQDFGGLKVASKIAYFHQDVSGLKKDGVAGSASILLGSGLNFTVASGQRDNDGLYVYGKVGLKRKFWSIGSTAMAIDYYNGNDLALGGPVASSNSSSWGAGVTQAFDAYNLEGFLAYRNHSYDDNLNSYNDISTVVFGARWSF